MTWIPQSLQLGFLFPWYNCVDIDVIDYNIGQLYYLQVKDLEVVWFYDLTWGFLLCLCCSWLCQGKIMHCTHFELNLSKRCTKFMWSKLCGKQKNIYTIESIWRFIKCIQSIWRLALDVDTIFEIKMWQLSSTLIGNQKYCGTSDL